MCAATLAGCVATPSTQTTPPAVSPALAAGAGSAPGTTGVCAILSINDTYRIEASPDGTGGMAAVRTLRTRLQAQYPDLLLFHAGDFLFPSLLSRHYKGAQMIDVLNRLDGSTNSFDPRLIVTFGNHEFDDDRASILAARLAQSEFRWVSSNIDFAADKDGVPKVSTHKVAEDLVIPCGGFQLGLFGLTVDDKMTPYLTRYRDPVETARARTKALKSRGATLIAGLTHLDIATDQHILQTLAGAGPDLLVGGHEHARQTRSANGRSVFKADADARTANLIRITQTASGPQVEHEWLTIGPSDPPADPALDGTIQQWLTTHDETYCREQMKLPPGCLAEKLSVAGAELVAEELEIRRYETNLGDYVVDRQLAAFAQDGAQIAFVNAGTLRLNYNIARGSDITRRNIEELFAYAAPLRLIEIDGATLQKVVDRAISGWTGQGHWLQIAGFAFRHDAASGKATHLTLLGERPHFIAPSEKIRAVVNSFLLDPAKGQDGYTMIGPDHIVDKLGANLSAGPDLRQLVLDALKSAGAAGIAPVVDGRICNSERKGPCLAK